MPSIHREELCDMLFNKKYLPIGSVVGVKNDSRRLLIIGRQVYADSNRVVRDYVALEYPNGFIDAEDKFILFDRPDIEVVYHYGYVDEVERELDQRLHEADEKGTEKGTEKGEGQ